MTAIARLPERALRTARVYGLRGTATRISRLLLQRVRAHHRHLWYELDLRGSRSRRELPAGFELTRAEDLDLADIAALPEAPSVPVMSGLRAKGHEVWLVRGGGRVVFVCWIFRDRAPVGGVSGGWIDLPSTIVCLEDSLTVPELRGRGIAPGAWSELADQLHDEGVHAIVTKVEDWNNASHVAVSKVGFQEIATMTLDRRWGRTRVTVEASGGGTGRLLGSLISNPG